jgi:hypothetical protein
VFILSKILTILKSCVFYVTSLCNLNFFLQTKWCPAPDCTCAVEFISDVNYDVSCNCNYGFCWNVSGYCFHFVLTFCLYFFWDLWSYVFIHSCLFMLVTFSSAQKKLTDQLTARLLISGFWRTALSPKIWIGLLRSQYSSIWCAIILHLKYFFTSWPSSCSGRCNTTTRKVWTSFFDEPVVCCFVLNL